MKVKVTYCAYLTKEVEISDEFQPLADPFSFYNSELTLKAIQAVEKATGIVFGDGKGDNSKYIVSVVDSATGGAMIER